VIPGELINYLLVNSGVVEKLTIIEWHYKIIMAGVDQFGGNNGSCT
jgi:hypothetical protein